MAIEREREKDRVTGETETDRERERWRRRLRKEKKYKEKHRESLSKLKLYTPNNYLPLETDFDPFRSIMSNIVSIGTGHDVTSRFNSQNII